MALHAHHPLDAGRGASSDSRQQLNVLIRSNDGRAWDPGPSQIVHDVDGSDLINK